MKLTLLNGAKHNDAQEFIAQIKEFLDGVVNHDGPPFYKHLNPDLFLISILPGDKVIDDYQRYLEFQEAWNKKKSSTWSYVIERAILHSPTLAFVVVLATYEDSGKFRKVLRIKDNFTKQGNTWFLTENQNTLVSENKI